MLDYQAKSRMVGRYGSIEGCLTEERDLAPDKTGFKVEAAAVVVWRERERERERERSRVLPVWYHLNRCVVDRSCPS